jgi:hypothetical protein
MPTCAELGIPFPLFEADVGNAADYVGLVGHVLPSMQRDAVDLLGALLGDATEVDQIDAEDTADGDM